MADLDEDLEPEDDEQESEIPADLWPIVTEPAPEKQKRQYNPAHRRLNEAAERAEAGPGSWWTTAKSRSEFAAAAERRQQEMQISKVASKVKTPLNFVGWSES